MDKMGKSFNPKFHPRKEEWIKKQEIAWSMEELNIPKGD
jgi:hypothetical protein